MRSKQKGGISSKCQRQQAGVELHCLNMHMRRAKQGVVQQLIGLLKVEHPCIGATRCDILDTICMHPWYGKVLLFLL